jgi:hypothetical protein
MRPFSIGILAVLCAAPLAAQFTPPPCNGVSPFTDVPADSLFCPWIKQMNADHLSQGCGGGKYCPQGPVTREQLSVILEKAVRGTDTFKIDAGTLDGRDSNDFQRRHARVAIVDFDGSGDYPGPKQALDALATWCGTPDFNQHCLVSIQPGSYYLTVPLVIPSYVDVAGTGEEQVLLIPGFATSLTEPVVNAGGVGEVRDLQIFVYGGDEAVGLVVEGDESERLFRRVTVHTQSPKLALTVRLADNASATFEDCSLESTSQSPGTSPFRAAALWLSSGLGSQARLRRSDISVNGHASSDCRAIELADFAGPDGAANSVDLEDSVVGVAGCLSGVGVRAGNDAIASMNGGVFRILSATARGALLGTDTDFQVRSAEIRAQGTTEIAIDSSAGSGGYVTLADAVLIADKSLISGGGLSSEIRDSVLASVTSSITSVAGDAIYVAVSRIDSAVAGTGAPKCVGAFDSGYDPLGPDCLPLP